MSISSHHESPLKTLIRRYLKLKVALGRRAEGIKYALSRLTRFLDAHQIVDLDLKSFSAWCTSFQHLRANTRISRMRIVYHLCLFRRRDEPNCFIPDPSQFPLAQPHLQPYIFSNEDILKILHLTNSLSPHSQSPLQQQVARLATVLAYTTGLRRGELVRITLGDYDSAQRVLRIRESKFYKSRLLPLSADAGEEIGKFLLCRRLRKFPCGVVTPLLLHNHGAQRGYSGTGMGIMMRKLFRRAGIRTPAGNVPRFHDLRFTFAIHAMLRWYQAGVDVQARLPALSTYMGHASLISTQYYLRYFEIITRTANERFDLHCSHFLPPKSLLRGDQ